MSNTELIGCVQHDCAKCKAVQDEVYLRNGDVLRLMKEREALQAEVGRLTLERDVNKRMRDQHFVEVKRLRAQLAAAQGQEPVNTMLVEALEEARNGLAWYQAMYPGATDGSDDEAMERIDAAYNVDQMLEAYRQGIAVQQAQPEPSEMTKEREAYIAGLESRTHEMRKKIEQLDYELRVARSLQERATYTPPKISDPDAPHPCFN